MLVHLLMCREFKTHSFGFQESVKLLAGIADTSKDGLISFAEFQAFEGLLCTPDALYKTAFQLFDTNGNGSITYSKLTKLSMRPTLKVCVVH